MSTQTRDDILTKFFWVVYTQMNWKVCFCLRRTIPQFLLVCIALVFNQSCFDASIAYKNWGSLLGIL